MKTKANTGGKIKSGRTKSGKAEDGKAEGDRTEGDGKPARSQTFEAGLAMRKQVLGPDYVENAFRTAEEFSMPFHELGTEFAWGAVWTRPGLTLRDRSLLTLAMCVALNRPNEVRIHLRGAIRNGCTRLEVREMLVQAMIYCGGPAALDAFHTVKEAWPEIEAVERELSGQPAGKRRKGKKAR